MPTEQGVIQNGNTPMAFLFADIFMIKSACRILVENMTGLPNIQIQIDELYGMVEQQNKMLTDINVKSSKFVYSLLEPLRLF